MTNYTKFAVRGTITVLVISLFAAFLGYLVRLVMARNLSVEDFGLFNSVFSFLGLLGVFKSLGFDKALIKFIPEFLHENKKDFIKSSIFYVCIIMLVINIIIILGVYLFSSYLSMNFFQSPKAGIVLKLLAIAFFVDSFVMVVKFAFQGFKKMIYFSVIDIVRMILILIIIFIGIKMNYGLLGPVIAYTITPFILLLVFGWILLKNVFPDFSTSKFSFDMGLIKKISKYSIFVTETSAAGMILYYTDIVALTYFSDLKSVGLYSVALPTTKVLLYFPRAISGVLLPLTSELWVKKKNDLLKIGIESLYKYSIILIIPAVFIMFSFSDLLITVLYGKGYIMASNSMKVLSIGMIFAVLYGINISFFAGIGKPRITAIVVYAAAAFNFVGNIILIPIFGIIGAAITTTISYFIMMAVGLFYIKKFINIEFPVGLWVKTFSAGIIFTSIIWVLKRGLVLNVWLETFIVLAIASSSYVILLFLFRAVTIEELKMLYKRVIH
ncbi:MAG TPA: flippase [Candidatus Nanoarchaeia archaeon]|nr:flippase [Candidatus Nanoarchaeia archaeon]